MSEQKKKLSDIVKDMTGLKQQWANTKPAPDTDKPIPPGEYLCELIGGEPFEARTGNPGFKVTLRVKDGPFASRLAWHDFYFTEKALPYTLRALEKIGVRDLTQLDEPFPVGLVVKAKIVVNKRDDGSERNELRTWELVRIDPPPAAVAPAMNPSPEGTPSPGISAPWAVDLDTLDTDKPKGDAQ